MIRELAEAAFLRRVDLFTGAQLVGRKGGGYSGIAIPYVSPGSPYVREYRLRRDHPDFEAGANGELRVKQKYLSPPGRGNLLYLPPGCDPALLQNAALLLIGHRWLRRGQTSPFDRGTLTDSGRRMRRAAGCA